MKNNLIYAIISIILYFSFKYYIPYWSYFIYPIDLFTTFLHEFGHWFFSLISWGNLHWLDINSDTSGMTTTSGWIRWMTVSWGYIWSSLFWALLLFSWANLNKYNKYITFLLMWLLTFSSLIWFYDITSSFIQISMAIVLLILYKTLNWNLSIVYQILGTLSLCHIVQDFNVWPTSDLANFSGILPAVVWMYIWLLIVLAIFATAIKITYFRKNS